jgi:hypothetical protein
MPASANRRTDAGRIPANDDRRFAKQNRIGRGAIYSDRNQTSADSEAEYQPGTDMRKPVATPVPAFEYLGRLFAKSAVSAKHFAMANLRSLWLGDLPLGEAFWTWAIGTGLVVNLTTSILFLVLITNDRPWSALFVGYALSVPYNVVAVVGVWRSAERYRGPGGHAELARIVTVIVMLLLSVT